MTDQKITIKLKPRFHWNEELQAIHVRREEQRKRNLQTYAATENDLTSRLHNCWECPVIEGKGRRTYASKYNRQAIAIILHHSKTGHVKDFVINESDLHSDLKYELTNERIGGTPKEYRNTISEIFTGAVKQLFEDLDAVYYHEHLADKLRVRMTK
jgi:hypothetical protein